MKRKAPLVLALIGIPGLGLAGTAVQSVEQYGSPQISSAFHLAQAENQGEGAVRDEPTAPEERLDGQGAADRGLDDTLAADSEQHRVLRASDLEGKEVQNAQGEDLGNIKDVVLKRDGSVSYVVLSYGETLGLGGKLVAVPWDQIQISREDEPLLVDVSRDRLEQIEGFDANTYPDQPDFAAFEEGGVSGDIGREGDPKEGSQDLETR